MEPWTRNDVFVAAAGDDVVCWADHTLVDTIVESITSKTARTKEEQTVGLAQVVKKVVVRDYWDIDFCSKWFFTTDRNNIDSWTCTRDFSKTLTTKMYYTGENNTIHKHPVLHAEALYD